MTDTRNNRVQVFNCNREFLYTFNKKSTASKQLDCPYGISVDADQFVCVCEKGNKCVSVLKTSGEFVTSLVSNPATIVIACDDGFVYVGKFRSFAYTSMIISLLFLASFIIQFNNSDLFINICFLNLDNNFLIIFKKHATYDYKLYIPTSHFLTASVGTVCLSV